MFLFFFFLSNFSFSFPLLLVGLEEGAPSFCLLYRPRGIIVGGSLRLLPSVGHDLLYQFGKHLVHINLPLCRSLQELAAQLRGQLLSFFLTYLPLVLQIAFILYLRVGQ